VIAKMKKSNLILIALLLVSFVVIGGCAKENTEVPNNTANTTGNTTGNPNNPGDDAIFCTEDAKICSDGSAVARDPNNNCEFPACPDEQEITMCGQERPQVCTREYNPVCGQVQVECIRAPCPPINQTFGNACDACANSRVISYTPGACEDN
jgi:hypothetical protein